MKTIFDVTQDFASGRLSAMHYQDALDHMPYGCCCCDQKERDVIGANQKLLGHDLFIVMSYKNVFGVYNDDDSFSFYRTDGEVIGEKAASYRVLPGELLELAHLSDDHSSLYRLDGSLIHRGACFLKFAHDGKLFAACDDNFIWTLYKIDGTKVAENITDCHLETEDFYMLVFTDRKAVVYDNKAHTQFVVPKGSKVISIENGTFSLRRDNLVTLYRSDTTKLLESSCEYRVFDNGLIWKAPGYSPECIYTPDLKPIIEGDKVSLGDNFGNLFRVKDDKDYLFDDSGKLIASYPYMSTRSCGYGYYLAWDEASNVVSLHRPDTSVVTSNLVGAVVFDNNWKQIFRSRSNVPDGEQMSPLCSLLDDKDNVVVENVDTLFYVRDYNAYVYAKDDKFSLVDAKGQVVVKDADFIYVFGGLYVVHRSGQKAEVRFFADL